MSRPPTLSFWTMPWMWGLCKPGTYWTYKQSNTDFHPSVWWCYSWSFGQLYFIIIVFLCILVGSHGYFFIPYIIFLVAIHLPLFEVIPSFYLLCMLAQFRTLARFASNLLNFASPYRLTSYENASALFTYLCRWFRFAQLAKGKKSRP